MNSAPVAPDSRKDAGIERFNTLSLQVCAVLFGLCVLAAFVVPLLEPREIRPSLQAVTFQYPDGCQPQQYDWTGRSGSDRISRRCLVDSNIFTDAAKYHLHFYGRGAQTYYRVGDDLLQIRCGYYATCTVERNIDGVFHR